MMNYSPASIVAERHRCIKFTLLTVNFEKEKENNHSLLFLFLTIATCFALSPHLLATTVAKGQGGEGHFYSCRVHEPPVSSAERAGRETDRAVDG